jgi:hypothetical protein
MLAPRGRRPLVEEISALHRRIFTAVDTDKNGKVTAEEMQAFVAD